MTNTPDEVQPMPLTITGPDGQTATIGGRTKAEQAALIAAQRADWNDRDERAEWANRILHYLGVSQLRSVDYLERFGDGSVGVPGFPNIGADWPTLPSAQANLLHKAMTWDLYDRFVMAHMLRVLVEVLRDLVRDSDIDPPAPPELG